MMPTSPTGSMVFAAWCVARRALVAFLLLLFIGFAPTMPAVAQEAVGEPQAAAVPAPDDMAEADLLAASPLAPAAINSPRETMESLRVLVQGATGAMSDAFMLAKDDSSFLDTPAILALKAKAIEALTRASSTLDLSNVPPATRRTTGLDSVLLLEEIFKRIPMPDLENIPDEAAVDAGEAPNGWTVPGTEIRMARLEGPDGEPQFLFSGETVRRLPSFYSRVRDLPTTVPEAIDYYQHFVMLPGLSTPIWLYQYVLDLPEWMLTLYAEQALWQWAALVILTALVGGLIAAIIGREMRRPQSVSNVSRSLQRLLPPIVVLFLLSVYLWLVDNAVNLTGGVLNIVEVTVAVLEALTLAVTAVLAFNSLAALIISTPRLKKESLDASLIRLVMRIVGVAVAGYILYVAAAEIGVPLYGILAGIGVGSLAIALAIRPTLENFIGGIILYADRPVKVGDFCKFGTMLGTVEAIGLRSTKIRGLDRTLVTVQNAEFAQMSITNFTRRDSNLMHTTISLRYETSPEQLTRIIDGIAAMLREDSRVNGDTVRVCFRGFGNYAYDVEIWAYVLSADWGRFLKIQEELLMRVIGIVDAEGARFAYPSQTTYLGTDAPAGRSSDQAAEMAALLSPDSAARSGA